MSWANPTLDYYDDDIGEFSTGGDSDEPTNWATVSLGDESWSTPEFLDFHTDSSEFSMVDILEETKTETRNGTSQVLSSLSQFANILARTGIHGPRHLKAVNLKSRAVKIGSGTQFTVFKERSQDSDQPGSGLFGNQGLVIKRVKVPLSREAGKSLASGNEYRSQLRSLELEILALCNPSIRGHRNIVHLDAWGYDYPYPDTPIPVLFMEAAIMTLTDFLKKANEHLLGPNPLDVKYQLALDVASGLEAMHGVRIVHGDIKCDNVLVFKQDNPKVPFCGKLNDFGVCIDMEAPGKKFTVEDYIGTPVWLAPEVKDDSAGRLNPFDPEVMLHIDSYSFGLVLLSIFTQNGEPPALSKDVLSSEDVIDNAIDMLRSEDTLMSPLRMQLTKAIRGLLAGDPWSRPLPEPELLRTDISAYASWLSASQLETSVAQRAGTMDASYNQGPRFWYKLDPAVFTELEEQYRESEKESLSNFPAEVLFGMAQKVTGMKPSYLERLIPFLIKSARQGFSPARAVYAQIMHAHDTTCEFEQEELDKWTLDAVGQGYLFPTGKAIPEKDLSTARDKFRNSGGFCADPFMKKPVILETAKDEKKIMAWLEKKKPFVDHQGNTMLHVAAVLGQLKSVQFLVETANVPVNVENNNQETALYKACQAGHADIIQYLLDKGATASGATKQEKLTPLHWLFMLPEPLIRTVGTRLVKEGGASVNAALIPPVGRGGDNTPRSLPMLHFPFEFPYGTPLHWAAFSRNSTAMEVLLDLGADIDATYAGQDASTTPLALATWCGEVETAKFLLARGANGKVKDKKSRNLLHYMTNYLPDRHGHLPQSWQYYRASTLPAYFSFPQACHRRFQPQYLRPQHCHQQPLSTSSSCPQSPFFALN